MNKNFYDLASHALQAVREQEAPSDEIREALYSLMEETAQLIDSIDNEVDEDYEEEGNG
jgi:hypothetical protein